MADPIIVVLGATGRVGQELLQVLPPNSRILAVSRTARDANSTSVIDWLCLDLTQPGAVDTTISALKSLVGPVLNVIVVDLVLDRTGVAAMRTSLAASAAYSIELAQRARGKGGTCAVVIASTTAVLASAIYQTPYGRAKRTQLVAYSRLRGARVAYLLPQLVADRDSSRAGVTWTYSRAGQELANGVEQVVVDRSPARLQLVSVRAEAQQISPMSASRGTLLRQMVPLHGAALITRRDSLAAHRAASHARLGLTPVLLRRRLDHHFVPSRLVRRLGRRLDADVVWV